MYVDETDYQLLDPWTTAGPDGDSRGPNDVPLVLDLGRYGPTALCP